MSLTSASLLIRIREGADSAPWDEFYAAYQPLLSRFARSQGLTTDDAQDVVQEIFLKLVRLLREFRYDPTRARFRTWLRRIARNHITDWRRARRRRRERACDPGSLAELTSSWSEFDWEGEHRQMIVRHALRQVRSESRRLTWRCFELHCLERRSAQEVAGETGLTVNGVYINAARTLDRVRKKCLQFDEELDDGPHLCIPG